MIPKIKVLMSTNQQKKTNYPDLERLPPTNFWKHLFHKGSFVNEREILNYMYWYNIEQDIPNQNIGVWMHPNQNNLRFTINGLSDIKKQDQLWQDGKKTAGTHAAKVKNNLQIDKNTEVSRKYNNLLSRKKYQQLV